MNLLELRKKMKMTQIDVAVKIGVSLTAYQLWEKGANNPNEENLKKLKELFKIK